MALPAHLQAGTAAVDVSVSASNHHPSLTGRAEPWLQPVPSPGRKKSQKVQLRRWRKRPRVVLETPTPSTRMPLLPVIPPSSFCRGQASCPRICCAVPTCPWKPSLLAMGCCVPSPFFLILLQGLGTCSCLLSSEVRPAQS